MNRNLRGSLVLLVTAFIWGVSFSFQSAAMDKITPLLFSTVRFFLAGLVLLPVIAVCRMRDNALKLHTKEEQHELAVLSIKGGVVCGITLAAGATIQQYALITTTAGKVAFITALYIIIVPIIGVFGGKKISRTICISVAVATVGFYLLCMKNGLDGIAKGDVLSLIDAFCFAFNILAVNYYMEKGSDSFILSCTEFFTVTILLLFPMLFAEGFHIAPIKDAWGSILYCGIISGSVAYTCQVIGQKDADPAIATLVMSLESVFAAIAGWLILNERLSPREIFGCVLVFAAVILAQLAPSQKRL